MVTDRGLTHYRECRRMLVSEHSQKITDHRRRPTAAKWIFISSVSGAVDVVIAQPAACDAAIDAGKLLQMTVQRVSGGICAHRHVISQFAIAP